MREEDSLWCGARECRLSHHEPSLEQRSLRRKQEHQVPLPVPVIQRPVPDIERPLVTAVPADSTKGSSRSEGAAGPAPSVNVQPSEEPGFRQTLDVCPIPATLPASWSVNQVAALRQELRAAEKTVEELKHLLREAEAAML